MTGPSVVAYGSRAAVTAIAHGCEEEGVPCRTSERTGDALALARLAAAESPLGIGCGADDDRVLLVLAVRPGRPYLERSADDARRIGHAAGRIAARRPL